MILYKNIDQILPNKLHGPMYYKVGVTCVYNGHLFYTLVFIIYRKLLFFVIV